MTTRSEEILNQAERVIGTVVEAVIGTIAFFISPDGKVIRAGENHIAFVINHPGKIAQFYSAVRGRPFVFESLAVGWTEGYARQQCGMTSISGIPKRQSWSGVEWETSEEE